jgi:HEAT repeat protein
MDLPSAASPDRREPYPPGELIVWPDDDALLEVRADWAAASERVWAMQGADELLAALREPDGRVRRWAARRLATEAASDPRTLSALIDALATDPASQVRESVAQDLGDFEDASAQAALRRACSDEDDDVKAAADAALGRRAGPTP